MTDVTSPSWLSVRRKGPSSVAPPELLCFALFHIRGFWGVFLDLNGGSGGHRKSFAPLSRDELMLTSSNWFQTICWFKFTETLHLLHMLHHYDTRLLLFLLKLFHFRVLRCSMAAWSESVLLVHSGLTAGLQSGAPQAAQHIFFFFILLLLSLNYQV